MRAMATVGTLAVLTYLGGCRRQPQPATPQAALLAGPAESSAERSSLSAGPSDSPMAAMSLLPALPPALPLFADDPHHPWNRLHQVLFAPLATVKRVSCLATRSCDVLPTPVGFFEETREFPAEYVDLPTQLMLPGIDPLLSADRHSQAVQAIQEALLTAPETQPVAAALLQNDLWERFDAVQQALSDPGRNAESRAGLRELRDGLGTLMAKLALPAATLHKVPSNLPLLVQRYPDVLAALADPAAGAGDEAESVWVELLSRSAALPRAFDPPLRDGTRHAMLVGYRAVFRIFVSISANQGGATWLRRELAKEPSFTRLPAGSRMVIYEQPLVISREGELVPLPLVTLLEARRVQAPAAPGQRIVKAGQTRLSELPFAVFEGKRQLLRALGPGQPGLLRLDPDTPFPQGGTCAPRPELLQPASSVCLMCHQPDTEHLSGTMSHGEQSMRVTSDKLAAVRAIIEEKRSRGEFKLLLGYFGH